MTARRPSRRTSTQAAPTCCMSTAIPAAIANRQPHPAGTGGHEDGEHRLGSVGDRRSASAESPGSATSSRIRSCAIAVLASGAPRIRRRSGTGTGSLDGSSALAARPATARGVRRPRSQWRPAARRASSCFASCGASPADGLGPSGRGRRRHLPAEAISPLATFWTVLLGIAKPMPGACAPPSSGSSAASVGIPSTRPERSTTAPPELPGLISALVWIAELSVAPSPSPTRRSSEETIPWLTLDWSPSEFPIARTRSPTRAFEESANAAGAGSRR